MISLVIDSVQIWMALVKSMFFVCPSHVQHVQIKELKVENILLVSPDFSALDS